MPSLNSKVIVYLVVAAAILLVGLRSLKAAGSDRASQNDASVAGPGSAGSRDGLRVSGGSRRLVVDVTGAVRRPGVYRFPQGARVMDAIKRAGGLSGRASPAAINRAATLNDGQQVVVPELVPSGGGSPAGGEVGPGAAEAPLSLGTATQEQLEEIDGIGPVTAEKILEFRDAQGGLSSIDDLDQVSGIGPVTMESLRAAMAP